MLIKRSDNFAVVEILSMRSNVVVVYCDYKGSKNMNNRKELPPKNAVK